MTDEICGETRKDGNECQRDAGWGVDGKNTGPCMDHRADHTHAKKLTEERINQICGAAQEGAFKRHCAQISGITPQTLRNWLNEGEDDVEHDRDTPFADLYFRFHRARGAGAVKNLDNARSEFVLERSYGYTKTEKREVEHSGEVDGFEVIIGGDGKTED